MVETCESCGNEYKMITKHWSASDCDYPKPSKRQKEILTGALMGDGSVGKKWNQFTLTGVEKEFIEWFANEMGIFSNTVNKEMSPEYYANENNKRKDIDTCAENYQQKYSVTCKCVPWIKEFRSWYRGKNNKKMYPNNLKLTPIIAKLWFVTDGWVDTNKSGNHNVKISCINEIQHNEREEYLVSLFEDVGFSCNCDEKDIVLYRDSSSDFMEWIGNPINGFEYKWQKFESGKK